LWIGFVARCSPVTVSCCCFPVCFWGCVILRLLTESWSFSEWSHSCSFLKYLFIINNSYTLKLTFILCTI
jgi:hypothetical protein